MPRHPSTIGFASAQRGRTSPFQVVSASESAPVTKGSDFSSKTYIWLLQPVYCLGLISPSMARCRSQLMLGVPMRKLAIATVLLLALFGAGCSSHESKTPTTTSRTTANRPLPRTASTSAPQPAPAPGRAPAPGTSTSKAPSTSSKPSTTNPGPGIPPGSQDFGPCEGQEFCPGENPAPANPAPANPAPANPAPANPELPAEGAGG